MIKIIVYLQKKITMNKLFLTIMICFSMLANTFAAKDTLQVSSKITSVTVFLEGAQLTGKLK